MGAEDNQLRQRDLQKSPEAYFYAKQGGVSRADGINDKSDYRTVNNAMKLLGFHDTEISTTWDVVAAILHLGNVTLTPDGEGAKIESNNRQALESAAKLLQVNSSELSKCLCERVIAAGGQVVQKILTKGNDKFQLGRMVYYETVDNISL